MVGESPETYPKGNARIGDHVWVKPAPTKDGVTYAIEFERYA